MKAVSVVISVNIRILNIILNAFKGPRSKWRLNYPFKGPKFTSSPTSVLKEEHGTHIITSVNSYVVIPLYPPSVRTEHVTRLGCTFLIEFLTVLAFMSGRFPPFPLGHFRPCWLSWCLRRSTFLWKPLEQISQPKGLNPVCLRLCVMRLELWLNALPHTWHLCGFSPVQVIETQNISHFVYIKKKTQNDALETRQIKILA